MAESIKDIRKNAPESAEAVEQLASAFDAYNKASDRIYNSYVQLQGEVVRLREELQQKNEQLERKSRLAVLGEMAAGMAHEIRNPLGAIKLYTSILERGLKGNEDLLQWARKISKGIHSLDVIVTDILAFTHEQNCDKIAVNFADLLNETLEYVRPQLKESAVEFDLDAVDRKLQIPVDRSMMQRVLMNLITNALQMMSESGTLTIKAGRCADEPPYQVRISIEDTGPGIKAQVMHKIFNPFFTTRDTGTGLGLAIVHRLIESHGGAVTASNRDTGGACFTILLP